jgi:hypothetical protein
MNTEEVIAMIDAIAEGREYIYENNGGTSRMLVDDDGISFTSQISFLIENPRTAREIAGALVAWANRKDGKPWTASSIALNKSLGLTNEG